MRQILNFFVLAFIAFLISCGGSDSLNINGEPEAIKMAESMMKSMGGKKEWSKLKSVYIRTVTNDVASGQTFVFEEWINLDVPKFMNRKTTQSENVIQLLNGNDGWVIRNNQISLMPNNSITNLRKWHENFFMTNMKKLAIGSTDYSVKLNGKNRFDLFFGDKFIAGFELNKENLPNLYYVSISNGVTSSMSITEWGNYKGLSYPLEIKGQNTMSHFKTDYWDPSQQDAEKAFKISFNPNDLVKK